MKVRDYLDARRQWALAVAKVLNLDPADIVDGTLSLSPGGIAKWQDSAHEWRSMEMSREQANALRLLVD